MTQLFQSEPWLLTIAKKLNPNTTIPESFILSDNTKESWQQIKSLFKLSNQQLSKGTADYYGLSVSDIHSIDLNLAKRIPETICRKFNVIGLREENNAIVFGTFSPDKITTIENQLVFSIGGKRAVFELLSPDDLDTSLTYVYSKATEDINNIHSINLDLEPISSHDDPNNKTVRLAHAIMRTAIEKNASDVHIQPFIGGGAIRFRVDGLLQRIATIPSDTLKNLSRYFKVHGDMDPSKTMITQDGRLHIVSEGKDYDIRMSVLPSYGGERIVARILNQNRIFSITQSGFSIADQQILKRMTNYPSGIILLTGPTGSGKTSTLYALLSDLNQVDINIITVEDPVEYVLPGTSQVPVNKKQGLTFASSLRSILRQDPDVVLIGEIRDAETAKIATQAALTGHLVLSTLHTNDALTTIPRLLNLGIDPQLLADSLIGVISQRLVRKLCSHCATPVEQGLTAAEEEFMRIMGEKPGMRAVGCEKCHYSGYQGRLPLIESIEINTKMRELLLEDKTDLNSLKKALDNNYRPMAINTAQWIISGQTTLSEAHRVMGLRFWNELAQLQNISVSSIQIGSMQSDMHSTASKILLLSKDQGISHELNQQSTFEFLSSNNATQLEEMLDKNMDTRAIVIDSRDMDKKPEDWLTDLRKQFAWSGIPVLFIIDNQQHELAEILKQYNAPMLQGFPVDIEHLNHQLQQIISN